MNRFARIGATGAALTLATLPLLPVVAVADDGPLPNKAQVEYQERVTAPLRIHFGAVPDSHLTKAQIEYVERSNAPVSSNPQNVQAKLVTDNGDAAAWQMALSAAAGVALTAGFVLASRGVSRHRHALAG